MKRPFRTTASAVLFALGLLATPLLGAGAARAEPHASAPSDDLFSRHIEGAARLEGRLLAPCCWDSSRQTLDIHGSPIATELRREIRTRLSNGESADAIEADLVSRYSEKILAVPPGNPLRQVGVILAVGMTLAFGAAIALLVRWQRRGAAAAPPAQPSGSTARDEWDDKLDAELDQD